METRKPPEFILELSAHRSNVKDIVKGTCSQNPQPAAQHIVTFLLPGILHTLFFHRLFSPLEPNTQDLLTYTLPLITDPEIASLIETKTTTLLRHLDSLANSTTASPQYNTLRPLRTTVTLSFLEKKRRKGWFVAKADEETVWESWVLKVEVLSARSEVEAGRNKRVMERMLGKAVLQVVETVNRERAHIPPITTNEVNPFPFQISVGGKG